MLNTVLRTLVISFIIVGISACSTVTIEGDVPKTPESVSGTHTVHSSFYNFNWTEPPAVTKCENGRGLARIRTHTNAAYALASILSLGLYVPHTIEWWCDGSPKDDGDEVPWVPPK